MSIQTRQPTVGSSVGAGDVAWTSPSNIVADDSFVAQVSLSAGQESEFLSASHFGFTIPVDAAVLGIVVKISRYSMGPVDDVSVQLISGGVAVGDAYSSVNPWPNFETVDSFGNSTDDWNAALTAADVNDDTFGVQIKCDSASGGTALVDFVEIDVYYSGGSTADHPRVETLILRRSPLLPRPMPYQSVILDVGTDVVEQLDVWEEPSTTVSILREPAQRPKPLVILTDVALIAASTPPDSTPGQVPMVILAIPSRPPARGPALAILTQFVTAGQGEVCLCPFGAVIVSRGFATATLVTSDAENSTTPRAGYSGVVVSSEFGTGLLISVCHC